MKFDGVFKFLPMFLIEVRIIGDTLAFPSVAGMLRILQIQIWMGVITGAILKIHGKFETYEGNVRSDHEVRK